MRNALLVPLLFIVLVASKISSVMAQNLVPNYSFEIVSACPETYGASGPTFAPPWVSPTATTPDIFNSCSANGVVDVPANSFGNQTPVTGDGYAGAYMKLTAFEYREYIQVQLLEPLVANEWYAVSFFVSLGEFGCGIEEIGAYFSVTAPSSSSVLALPYTPQIVYMDGFLNDYDNWTLISGCFQAEGGEEYITIGNFNNDANTPFDPNCQGGASYYYIEDVTVMVNGNPGEIPIELDGPVSGCFSYEIDPGIPDVNYTWEDGSSNPTLLVIESGTYSVTVSEGCNLGIDSVEVIINGNFDPIDLGPDDVTICNGDEYAISLDPDLSEYQWQDGSNDPEYIITISGTYSVTLDDGCAVSSDQIVVEVLDPPSPFSLGDDMFLCLGTELEFSFDPDLGNFLWQDGNMSSTYFIDQGGTYTLTISNICGEENDEITITDLEGPEVEIGPDEITLCAGDSLEIQLDPQIGEILWQDGTSTPDYTISEPGLYNVFVTNICGTGSDQMNVIVVDPPVINLGTDTLLCEGESLILSTDQQGPYLWQDNSTADTFLVNSPGAFSLSITNFCGIASDLINVGYTSIVTPPAFGPDLTLCPGEQTILYANNTGANYLWQDGSTQDSFVVNASGTYTLQVSNSCSSKSDTIVVTVNANPPQVNLSDQLALCQGQSITLDATITGVSYLWSDNSQNQQLTVNAPGAYSVTVSNACGTDRDTVIIADGGPAPSVDLGNDINICPGETMLLSPAFSNVDTWLWQDGSAAPTYNASAVGLVIVVVNNTCGSSSDTLIVNPLAATPPLDLGLDTSICSGQSFVLSINTPGVNILWPDGSTGNDFTVSNTGQVFAAILNACGTSFDTIIVSSLPDIPTLNLGVDQSLCPGELITFSPGIANVQYLWQDGSTSNTYQSTQQETVILTIANSCGTSTDTVEIEESTQGPQVNLGPDIQVCAGEVVTIPSGISGVNYLWQDGSSSPDFVTTLSGTFILNVSNNCGTDADTINVDISGVPPSPTLGPDTTLCEGITLLLTSSADAITSIQWQDGSSAPTFSVSSPGTFILAESNRCGDAADTIVVDYLDAPDPFTLGPDTTLCPGETITLTAPSAIYDILWQDGSSLSSIIADQPATYALQLSNDCGTVSDQFVLSYDTRTPQLNPDASIPWCEGDIITLDATQSFDATYSWSTGAISPVIQVSSPGLYSIDVSTPCSTASQNIDVVPGTDCVVPDVHNDIAIPNVFSPNSDGINDIFSLSFGADLQVTAMEGSIFDRWGNLVLVLPPILSPGMDSLPASISFPVYMCMPSKLYTWSRARSGKENSPVILRWSGNLFPPLAHSPFAQ
ncbi:MAG: gliding motility-associated C-terminal domain-containing protein [Saprospiraceae bacterium]|nr:gliding motility-associated C-terminal domain-containing protein [Candidatus Opimibacter iunctus]